MLTRLSFFVEICDEKSFTNGKNCIIMVIGICSIIKIFNQIILIKEI